MHRLIVASVLLPAFLLTIDAR